MKTKIVIATLIALVTAISQGTPLRCPGWFGQRTHQPVYMCGNETSCGLDSTKARATQWDCTIWCCPASGTGGCDTCTNPQDFGCCPKGSSACSPGNCNEGNCSSSYPGP